MSVEQPADAGEDAVAALSWTVSPDTSRPLHLLAYGLYAPLGASGLGLAAGGVVAAVALLLEGSVAPVLLGVLAVVVALSRPPVLAAIRSDETDASLGWEGWTPSWRGVLAASVLCGAAILAAAVHSRAAAVAVGGLSFAAGLLSMALYTDASVDDGRLETQYSGVELRTLSGVRSAELLGVTALWLSYARGADSFRNPRLIAVPSERAGAVRAHLDAGIAADPEADPIGRAERAIVALFGLGVVAMGPVLLLLVGGAGEEGILVVGYLLLYSLVFAGPMFWYAWKR